MIFVQVNDSSMTLLGEGQEEDRKLISDLVIAKMEAQCKPVQTTIRSAAATLPFFLFLLSSLILYSTFFVHPYLYHYLDQCLQ
jgi:hypothetical protein